MSFHISAARAGAVISGSRSMIDNEIVQRRALLEEQRDAEPSSSSRTTVVAA